MFSNLSRRGCYAARVRTLQDIYCVACRAISSHQTSKQRRTKALLDKIIRVDHAGELGADRIYEGQIAVLGRTAVGPLIKVRFA